MYNPEAQSQERRPSSKELEAIRHAVGEMGRSMIEDGYGHIENIGRRAPTLEVSRENDDNQGGRERPAIDFDSIGRTESGDIGRRISRMEKRRRLEENERRYVPEIPVGRREGEVRTAETAPRAAAYGEEKWWRRLLSFLRPPEEDSASSNALQQRPEEAFFQSNKGRQQIYRAPDYDATRAFRREQNSSSAGSESSPSVEDVLRNLRRNNPQEESYRRPIEGTEEVLPIDPIERAAESDAGKESSKANAAPEEAVSEESSEASTPNDEEDVDFDFDNLDLRLPFDDENTGEASSEQAEESSETSPSDDEEDVDFDFDNLNLSIDDEENGEVPSKQDTEPVPETAPEPVVQPTIVPRMKMHIQERPAASALRKPASARNFKPTNAVYNPYTDSFINAQYRDPEDIGPNTDSPQTE
ncbi:hypothetical protein IKG06_00230 [Candidatus Saccharibacteria bacterium]|nr:hypothetical protein [Candidatus Saccharibacteria bacterium]